MKQRPAYRAHGAKLPFQALLGAVAGVILTMIPCGTENAAANGDTRTIQLTHAHTHESISATYLVNGSYDRAVLDKLNWFLRDWRRDEKINMDPRLFDVIWEVYRESGSRQPVEVMSAYRSPETNAMLRRRSRAVAEHSQHILGKAMDQHYFDVPMSKIREIAMRLQRGGVGFYPTAGTPFVHMDVGGVRHWPRMSYDQLARLFPDGKTVHIPSNGQPLPGYEEARAELEARGDGSYPTANQLKSKGFFAWLFGSGSDEDEDGAESGGGRGGRGGGPSRNPQVATADRAGSNTQVAMYDSSSKDGGSRTFFASQQASPAAPTTSYGRVAREAAPPASAPQAAPPPQATLALAMAMNQQTAPARQQPEAQATSAPRAVPDLPVPEQALMSNGLAIPVPPRRPMELAALTPDSPLPPSRPPELSRPVEQPAPTPGLSARMAKADAISALLGATSGHGGNLPSVITQGSSPGKAAVPAVALAYAAQSGSATERSPVAPLPTRSVPLPVVRPADLVSARLDRSNFRSLTSIAKTERTTTHSALGSSVVGVRAASRANPGVFAFNTGVATSFGAKASALSTDRFSGPAVAANETLVTARRADTVTRNSQN